MCPLLLAAEESLLAARLGEESAVTDEVVEHEIYACEGNDKKLVESEALRKSCLQLCCYKGVDEEEDTDNKYKCVRHGEPVKEVADRLICDTLKDRGLHSDGDTEFLCL